MKDEQTSEEKLMGELDRMYRHVADLEITPAGGEHNDTFNEHEHISDPVDSPHAKIIPFPGHRIHLPSGEPSEEEPEQKRTASYRRLLIIASSFVIFLTLILIMVPLKGMIAPRGSERGDPHPLTFPVDSTLSSPVPREPDVLQNIEERQQRAETMPRQSVKPNFPLTQKRYYTVQVGAFRHWENASELIDTLQEKDLEAYWIEIDRKGRGVIYKVFSGYFTDRHEAAEFMKGKDILKNYPDSFVREILF